ncbi:hypothetical protein [Litorisediminicola beolgyonensis]|uniref:Uncharacterized protein n=1 Tax=Litorisediminicola beolgyonensis TaxID=1173614 RepID=A0ABW3ZIF1_9RHOB
MRHATRRDFTLCHAVLLSTLILLGHWAQTARADAGPAQRAFCDELVTEAAV